MGAWRWWESVEGGTRSRRHCRLRRLIVPMLVGVSHSLFAMYCVCFLQIWSAIRAFRHMLVSHMGVLRGSDRADRSALLFSGLRVRFDDASVCGVLETDWLWLFLAAGASLSLLREFPDTALTLDCGRCWEVTEEAVGGGRGEGNRRLPLFEFRVEVWVEALPWADCGLRKGAWVVLPLSLLLRSTMGLPVISGASVRGLPVAAAGPWIQGPDVAREQESRCWPAWRWGTTARLRGRRVDGAGQQHARRVAGNTPSAICFLRS